MGFQTILLGLVQVYLVVITWFFIHLFHFILLFLFLHVFFISLVRISSYLFLSHFNLFLSIKNIYVSLEGWIHIHLIILILNTLLFDYLWILPIFRLFFILEWFIRILTWKRQNSSTINFTPIILWIGTNCLNISCYIDKLMSISWLHIENWILLIHQLFQFLFQIINSIYQIIFIN